MATGERATWIGAMILLLASVGPISAATVLEDTFELFELGVTWKEHGAGVPDINLGVGVADGSEVLQMITSGTSDEFFGIETITPIPLAGVTELTIDARLRPINQGVLGTLAAAEVALIGSTGGMVRAFASNNPDIQPDGNNDFENDWADHYEDSLGNIGSSGPWPHCDPNGPACDAMRNLVISISTSDTILQAFDDLDEPGIPTWEISFSDFTLANLGTSLTIALRQLAVDGGDNAVGFFDHIVVTATGGGALPGDFDRNGVLDTVDINLLQAEISKGTNAAAYDLNADAAVNVADQHVWVRDLKKTWIGDSNLDGLFNSSDLVAVFTLGKYEAAQPAGWEEGDWNADLVFSSGDFVAAFSDGGYEQGPRPAVAAVPEPRSWPLNGLVALGMAGWRRRHGFASASA